MSSKVTTIKYVLAIAFFVVGAAILLYPPISGVINEQSYTKVLSNYEESVASQTDSEQGQKLESAKEYNERLVKSQESLVDPFGANQTESVGSEEISFLKLSDVLGYVQVPKISVKLPIYEGTNDDVLQKGIGWLSGTSLPFGGQSTNCVLTGHRGLPTAKLFTELDRLERGDEFYIRNASEILAYSVIDVRVIDPSQTDELAIVEGEDRATLLTCHPYMINSHRLLVIGERIPYTGQLEQTNDRGVIDAMSPAEQELGRKLLIVTAACGLAVLVIWKPWRSKRKNGGVNNA